MSEKRESDEFEDDEADEAVGNDDPDLDHLIKDLDAQKRRGGPKPGEPAWRRLEKYMEQKRTAELLSDFEDYAIGDPEPDGGIGEPESAPRSRRGNGARPRRKTRR